MGGSRTGSSRQGENRISSFLASEAIGGGLSKGRDRLHGGMQLALAAVDQDQVGKRHIFICNRVSLRETTSIIIAKSFCPSTDLIL